MNAAVPDLLPARMLNEYAYCPRLFYLEWVEAEWADSADTEEGRLRHRRVDLEQGSLPEAKNVEGGDAGVARSVTLSSEALGLIARIDLVETDGETVSPVDYKRGEKPDVAGGSWEADRVQLCAQALLLREHGYQCNRGFLYYAASRERVEVAIDDALVERTLALAAEARATAARGMIPPPLVDSPKCPRCSLVGICLPDETSYLQSSTPEQAEPRRMVPARDLALPVYVQTQGMTVTKQGDRLVVRERQQTVQEVRLLDVSQLCVFGNVQVTTQLVRELCEREIPICYFSYGGWFYGVTHGMGHRNVALRQQQYAASADAERSLALGRRFVEAKIRNCRTLLRRNGQGVSPDALQQLSDLAERVRQAGDPGVLLGLEGLAARVYFSQFATMLKPRTAEGLPVDFEGRNRRPPRDPVNALLSFAYALLVKDVTVTLQAVGFDPYLGFMHTPRYGRPALALDLMEEFRPLIADSVVLSVVNNGEITAEDFVQRGLGCALKPDGRRRFLAAYGRRMDSLVTHPVFGYTISYRRVLEVQARLLGRYLGGEIAEYPQFLTR
mgnify:CR=1 FL=1